MAKKHQTPEQRGLRIKAYEAYLASSAEGKRMSLRSIAMQMGMTLGAVAYWKKTDRWDEKVQAALNQATMVAGRNSGAILALLRQSLFDHIRTLNRIIESSARDADRIRGIKEFVDICQKFDILRDAAQAPTKAAIGAGFDDTLEDDSGIPERDFHGSAEQTDVGRLHTLRADGASTGPDTHTIPGPPPSADRGDPGGSARDIAAYTFAGDDGWDGSGSEPWLDDESISPGRSEGAAEAGDTGSVASDPIV